MFQPLLFNFEVTGVVSIANANGVHHCVLQMKLPTLARVVLNIVPELLITNYQVLVTNVNHQLAMIRYKWLRTNVVNHQFLDTWLPLGDRIQCRCSNGSTNSRRRHSTRLAMAMVVLSLCSRFLADCFWYPVAH